MLCAAQIQHRLSRNQLPFLSATFSICVSRGRYKSGGDDRGRGGGRERGEKRGGERKGEREKEREREREREPVLSLTLSVCVCVCATASYIDVTYGTCNHIFSRRLIVLH